MTLVPLELCRAIQTWRAERHDQYRKICLDRLATRSAVYNGKSYAARLPRRNVVRCFTRRVPPTFASKSPECFRLCDIKLGSVRTTNVTVDTKHVQDIPLRESDPLRRIGSSIRLSRRPDGPTATGPPVVTVSWKSRYRFPGAIDGFVER